MAGFIKTIGNTFVAPTTGTATLTLSSGVTAKQGSIIVTVSFGNVASVSVSSVTDSQGNVYVNDHTTAGNANNEVISIWRCQDPKALTSGVDTITASLGAGTTDHGLNVIADLYSRLGAPNVTSDHFTTPGATTSVVSATPQASDVVAISAVAFNAGVTTLVVASPFTIAGSQFQSTTTSISCITAFDNNPGTSSITATYTETTTGHTSVATIVTYPPAPLDGDTGTGADTATKIGVSAADTGTGADNASIAVKVTGTDTGSGADTASVTVATAISGADTGSGADNASFAPVPPGPVVNPGWLAARAGLPGDSTATNKSAQIGQFLASHGITPVYQGTQLVLPQGTPSLAWLNLTQFDIAQAFTMPAGKTTIGRVTLPLKPTGVGADVVVGLYTDSGGNPGTLITQTRLPNSWLNELGAPNGLANAGPLATAANNTMFAGPVTTTMWTLPAVTLNGAGLATAAASSGNYTIVAGGYDRITNVAVPNVVTIQYVGGTSVANPVNQPPLPQAAWGGMVTTTLDTIVFAGGVNGASFLQNVWTASWDPNTGTVGAWTAQANLPNAWVVGSLASWGDFVYIASGNTNYNPSTAIQSVYYANAANGQIQSWTAAPPLPQPRNNAYVGVIGNWLIVAGGSDASGTPVTTVYYSAIRSDGSLVGWQTGPSLPESNYAYNQGWDLAILGNALVLVSGTTTSAVVDDMPILVFSADGPSPAWTHQLPIIWAQNIVGYYPGNNGTWQVFSLGGSSYYYSTLTPCPLISIPLPASGLTPLATYHIVVHQAGGDLNDYVQSAFLQQALPSVAQSAAPGSGGPWTNVASNYSVPMGVWDGTPGGRILHLVEDSAARITSLVYAAVSGQLLGLCEATQFADGTWLDSVSEVEYSGMAPVGVAQLA